MFVMPIEVRIVCTLLDHSRLHRHLTWHVSVALCTSERVSATLPTKTCRRRIALKRSLGVPVPPTSLLSRIIPFVLKDVELERLSVDWTRVSRTLLTSNT